MCVSSSQVLLLEALCAMPGLSGGDADRVARAARLEVTRVLLGAVAASTTSDSVAMRMAWS